MGEIIRPAAWQAQSVREAEQKRIASAEHWRTIWDAKWLRRQTLDEILGEPPKGAA